MHGVEDEMVPIELSRMFYEELKKEVGSRTWELQREGFDFLERFIGRG